MVTGSGVDFYFLVPGLCLPHQQVGACRLAQRVVLTVSHEQGERDGFQVVVNVLQTSANTHIMIIYDYMYFNIVKRSYQPPRGCIQVTAD